MTAFWAAVAGAVIALLGTLLGGNISGRRGMVHAAHAERRDVYVRVLADLRSLDPLLRELRTSLSPLSDSPIGVAVRDKFTGDRELRASAEALSEKIDGELVRIGDSLALVELIGGTPVFTEVLRYLLDLRLTSVELRTWIAGNVSDRPIHERVDAYQTRNLSKLTTAMQQDLAEPWFRQYHDRGARRWYHVLRSRPRHVTNQ